MMANLLTEFQFDRQVLRLTLNTPKANILDMEMLRALSAALNLIGSEPQVKMVVLTGAGDHFSFGASVAEHKKEIAPAMLKQFHGLFLQLAQLGTPLAVLISGQCLGGAMELALAGHFIFADNTAQLGQPEINLGVFAPPASLLLPLRIGTTRAEELLITGRIISGAEAAEMDLVTRLYPDRAAMEEGLIQWLEEAILPKSASSLRQSVMAARTQTNHFLERLLPVVERQYVESLMATHDANEGIAAFLEKREPQWENR